jgi:hypothetical protein
MTPFESWSGKKLEVTHFHIFGSCAWVASLQKEERFGSSKKRMYFCGLSRRCKGVQIIGSFNIKYDH